MNKPIGFDNWRRISFVTRDGSGRAFGILASFYRYLSGDLSYHTYRGPDIILVKAGGLASSAYNTTFATFADAGGVYGTPRVGTDPTVPQVVIFTKEPHGFQDYQVVTLAVKRGDLLALGLAAEFVVRVKDARRFVIDLAVPFGTVVEGADIGIAGIDTESFCLKEEYPGVTVGPPIMEDSRFKEPWNDVPWVE